MKVSNFLVLFLTLVACKSSVNKTPVADSTIVEKKQALPEFASPVAMKNWKLGNPENTKIVIDMYKAWDEKDATAIVQFFADSADLDLPETGRVSVNKSNVYDKFIKSRKQYDSTHNRIIAAYALQNEDNNDEWVTIMTYAKWVYKNGTRDSMLYMDNWKLKAGKMVYLNSLEQQPPKKLLDKLERAK